MKTLFQKLKGRLVLNSILNLFGQAAPMLAAIFCIPILIEKLGVTRFGFITLSLMIVGYFSLFDMGLGRALTQMTASRIGGDKEDEIAPLVWTGLLLMTGLALMAMVLAIVLTPLLVEKVIRIPPELQTEARWSLYLLAAALPLVVTVAGLRGVLEAYQKFAITTAIRIPMGLYSFIAPALVTLFSSSLPVIVAVLVAGRIIAWSIYFTACLKAIPGLKDHFQIDRSLIKPLFQFGGWMTFSNVIAPVMLYMDRFIVSALISLQAVAYYTTPFEVVTKMFIVPTAIMGVMFPALSQALQQDKMRARKLYRKTTLALFALMLPPTILIIIFAKPGLTLWLGSDFASNSFRVAQILTAGVLISAMAQPSYTFIQAAGRPKITAIIHMCELPLYLTYLWLLVSQMGILGAAIAWLIRVSLSCTVLTIIAFAMMRRQISCDGMSIQDMNYENHCIPGIQ